VEDVWAREFEEGPPSVALALPCVLTDLMKVLPVWSDRRKPIEGDPIGCPVSPDEMVAYLNPFLSFAVLPKDMELVGSGRVDDSMYWLWAFYEHAKHRWNLIVFSNDDGRTWMCADDNPYELNDHNYVEAIHNQEY
jgi:hypothetical protein